MGKRATAADERLSVLATALQACKLVKALAEETGNCSVCGQEFEDHADGCPYELACEALEQEELRREGGHG